MELFRLIKPFDMKLIAHDPYADPKLTAELGVELVGLEDVFRRSDFVSVSCPLTGNPPSRERRPPSLSRQNSPRAGEVHARANAHFVGVIKARAGSNSTAVRFVPKR